MSIKIAHESPISIFDKVQSLTDYDYALVHLLEENEQYRDLFFKAKEQGREIILDNSIFELGEAFDPFEYKKWIEKLLPTWYIIPDSLENSQKTIDNAYNWFAGMTPSLTVSKKIGVVQGRTYQELCLCYKELVYLGVDMIGVSFDYSYYKSIYPNINNKLKAWYLGRQSFLRALSKESFFRKDIPIHLLGCSLYQEFEMYNEEFKKETDMNIYSLDTSNPVVYGMIKGDYPEEVSDKPSIKLFELIDAKLHESQEISAINNINRFKQIVNGHQ